MLKKLFKAHKTLFLVFNITNITDNKTKKLLPCSTYCRNCLFLSTQPVSFLLYLNKTKQSSETLMGLTTLTHTPHSPAGATEATRDKQAGTNDERSEHPNASFSPELDSTGQCSNTRGRITTSPESSPTLNRR